MKSPLIISVSALALLTLSATLFAQTATGSSLITQMKAAVHDFTLATDLNPGVTDLKSGPVSGKKTGDMLTAEEYNRILELVGQGGGGGSDGGFTTTLFDDITYGLANGGVKTYTCPQNQYVLSVTSIMVPSGQYSCANSPNADKKSVSYNSCAALTGQRWHTHVICGGGGGNSGGSSWVDVSLTDTTDFDKLCEYRFQMLTGSNVTDDPYIGNDPFHYINIVDNNRLTWFVTGASPSVLPDYHHINSDSRTIYRVSGAPYNSITINKIQKKC